ncbi:MAG: hypothetical protein LAO55_19265 [Acidobacteriia bacterium]|nr:hypothetical protein [Terriglobia bacterium]
MSGCAVTRALFTPDRLNLALTSRCRFLPAKNSEDEKAAEWLGKAIEQRHPLVLIMLNGGSKAHWRANRYLPALLRKVHLPETI